MLFYDELDKLQIPKHRVFKDKGIEYINLSCAFDIETTSTYINGTGKTGFMYVWFMAIEDTVIYGRTWEQFILTLEHLADIFQTNEERRLVFYVHNLGYEFQFFCDYLQWIDIFAINERKPIKAVTVEGIEFRDSYILSGYSLANTARNLVHHEIEKLEGDLDYSLIRHSGTPLTKEELDYCEHDVLIIVYYIREQLLEYGNITKIPMTNTSRVRDFVRNKCYYTSKTHKKTNAGKYNRYRKMMLDLTVDRNVYGMLKRAFMGGFTHANSYYVGKVLNDVSSMDFNSSYPAVMLSEKFPMSRFKPLEVENISFQKATEKYALVFNAKFTNLEPKFIHESYISESKCRNIRNAVINNGRIYRADEITTTITEVDYKIMQEVYSWDELEVSNTLYAHKGYLPKPVIEAIIELYEKKTVLKGVEGSETEYMLSKGMLNSVYGMTVTDIVKDKHLYGDNWFVEPVDVDEELDKYNESKNRFLYYGWGVWITAYSRLNLWTGITALEQDYVYSDTDSLKFLNYEKHADYFNWYNNQLTIKLQDMCKTHKIDFNLLSPKSLTGEQQLLGIWDYEGTYTRFKTLGAKRYLVEENKRLQLTVAGLSKQNGLEYMVEQANGDSTAVFDSFTDELYIPADKTGKMTHTYIDTPISFQCTDYLGNTAMVNQKTGIHLEPCEFTLSISRQFNEFLRQLANGYVFRGMKNV